MTLWEGPQGPDASQTRRRRRSSSSFLELENSSSSEEKKSQQEDESLLEVGHSPVSQYTVRFKLRSLSPETCAPVYGKVRQQDFASRVSAKEFFLFGYNYI